jgi:hypothetical protein
MLLVTGGRRGRSGIVEVVHGEREEGEHKYELGV